ncbi:MAG: sulfatase [Chloroflexi bacterium]|nr:sulfatase [Chloroflexota bacterium]OJV95331.1 MAG: sulfatase [Chloroflexi bacterium 54-19]
MTGQPNILFISTHDINPDLSCYAGVWPGAEYAHTPNLDKLAAEGARFDQAYATTPVCAPSRSAIMTGMFPTAIGTMHMRTHAVPPPEVHVFTEYLREAGYYCTNNFFTDFQFKVPVTAFDDCSFTAHWRNRPNPDQPFFAAFHGMVTHESQVYVGEEEYQKNTARLTPEERHDPTAAPIPPYYPDSPVFRKAFAQYSDNITAMDYWVGDFLKQLEEDGLADNTLVVFWSDHGRGFPRAKRWPYEAGLRVPLIVRWPGKIQPGTAYQDPVYLMDLAATLLNAAGVSVPGYMHARPLFDEQGRFAPARPLIFGGRDRMDEQEDTTRSVRDGRFHYLRNFHPDRPYFQYNDYGEHMATWQELRTLRFRESQLLGMGENHHLLNETQRPFLAAHKPEDELYDLLADPHETHNLADDPRYAAEVARLRQAIEDWQKEYGDLGMLPEEELVESWRPGGEMQPTATPDISIQAGMLVASCQTEGASIGWTTDPPPDNPPAANQFIRAVGGPNSEGRHWQLYTGPVPVPEGQTVWVRAHRIGFRESADVVISSEAAFSA